MDNPKNKNKYFEIGEYLMNLDSDKTRQNFITLTSLLNQEKDDSINIPKRLINIRNLALFNYHYYEGKASIATKDSSIYDKRDYNTFLCKYDNLNKEKNELSIINEMINQQYYKGNELAKATQIRNEQEIIDGYFQNAIDSFKAELDKIKKYPKNLSVEYLKLFRQALFEDKSYQYIINEELIEKTSLPMEGLKLFFSPTSSEYIHETTGIAIPQLQLNLKKNISEKDRQEKLNDLINQLKKIENN